MHIAGKHCTNGMNSVVAVEALKTKASKGGDDRGLLKSELVFYDGMDDGVAFYARHPDTMPSMVVLNK